MNPNANKTLAIIVTIPFVFLIVGIFILSIIVFGSIIIGVISAAV